MAESERSISKPVVLAMTGASGTAYGCRLLDVLLASQVAVHLSISPAAAQVIQHELGCKVDLERFDVRPLLDCLNRRMTDGQLAQQRLEYFHYKDLMAPIASGSHLTSGMIVCPCSGGTLSAIAHGASGNLIERAAEVHLKERRKLILVPRETPLSWTALNNMQMAVASGAVMLPASPAWYHGASTLDDLIDFIVARILDQLDIPHSLIKRWGD